MESLLTSTSFQAFASIIVLLVMIKIVLTLFKKPEKERFSVRVRCRDCKWTGMVGKYNKRCPSCNGTNGVP